MSTTDEEVQVELTASLAHSVDFRRALKEAATKGVTGETIEASALPTAPLDDSQAASVIADSLLNHARLMGQGVLAQRIAELLTDEDVDETSLPLLSSLAHLIEFTLDNEQLSPPHVAVSRDGLMQAEWIGGTDRRWVVRFLPEGRARYAVLDRDEHGAVLESGGIAAAARLLDAAAACRVLEWAAKS